ncbi:hypothetical protein NMG60_11004090 [Bertholletia excelsa]
MIFSFVEGAFVTALRNGEWILLDEVNLAPPETLQRVIGVLEEENKSLCLAERGDVDYVHRHPDFRLFACMNPATDAGKRDLPYVLRNKFTEYFVDDVLDDEDLTLFVNQFMGDDLSKVELVKKIVHFYKAAKKESEERLQDGANQKPQYSLRSLYRALEYTNKAKKFFGFQKALYDGFSMFFLTLLDEASAKLMNQMIASYLLGGNIPPHRSFDAYLAARGNSSLDNILENYVLTKSVKEHLKNLARAIYVGRYPVLLQGPTSSGKTSLVRYLAAITGHEFVRINNHEHTDLQEYLGSYITDASGRLVFHEGALVKAVRNGYWIVLDELNLAPSDVLEALNRLLDDNRELFVPELGETIRAHPDFMLFATQNPPTLYGGRKMLSRAFRNRFVEIHVDEIPETELSTILEKRCKIPESYAKKMVEVMKELQLHRQGSKIFAGKHGFITPRDLFRWADRFRIFGNSYEDLARDGYFLLAERLRDETEKTTVREVLERHLRVKLAVDDLYKQEPTAIDKSVDLCKCLGSSENLGKIVWTESMWRLYFLIERCYKMREPVLLVGETGGGKTTVCQLLSIVLRSSLHILNCHQYTETSDFLGGFYPTRERARMALEFKDLCEQVMLSKPFVCFPGVAMISTDIGQASSIIDQLALIVNSYRQGLVSHPDVTLQDLDWIEKLNLDLTHLHQKWQTVFVWQDGPLVKAMKNGDLFLVDEISLADDSVLERLNSVLEPERKLALAEKGGSDLEIITAHPNFFLLATMNPGGDYGKKELSPALRNRFTEIWVPSVNDINELSIIALQRISNPELSCIVDPLLNFWKWFNHLETGRILTVRDLLSWIAFIDVTDGNLQPEEAFLHGAFLVLLDGLSLGTGISRSDAAVLRDRCLSFLLDQLKVVNPAAVNSSFSTMQNYGWGDVGNSGGILSNDSIRCDTHFGIHPFYIAKGDDHIQAEQFEFMAPTTCRNTLRVLRAMQLPKPVLLEGSPGVGKTSLIVSLGKFSGHSVVRINLSEQTDMMDLLGSDLPVETDDGVRFSWCDGILLQALKSGSWVLLDELNLAPQSVLEGLNAILDHRAEVFIPELGVTFKCPSTFRIFACQNPSYQGGGRKGLPKSFLNRFTKVYVDELVEDDHLFICSSLYPTIAQNLLTKLILFNKRLHEETMLYHKFAHNGSPWEFNLRDVIRSCQIIEGAPERSKIYCFLDTIYIQRMRTAADREKVVHLYEEVFGLKPFLNPYPRVELNPQYLVVGNSNVKRNHFQSPKTSNSDLKVLPEIRHSLEAAVRCVQHQWLCILVGPPSSGKTSLIRLLARLTGNALNELNLSSASDITELLGCFEQYNAVRHYQVAIGQVESYVNEYCCLQLEAMGKEFIKRQKALITQWLAFSSSIGCSTTADNWKKKTLDSIPVLVEIIEYLKLDLEESSLPVSWSTKDLDGILNTVVKVHEDYQRTVYSAKFEWVTGLLAKAIENGEWVVLENANLCNPTVLDRINSLVEPHGSITINECGSSEGKSLVLHPHPKFQMFLTVDPSHGEVSRAMRNRGVEIYMMQPYWLLDSGSIEACIESELRDAKRFLILSGIPLNKMLDSMAKAHIYAKAEGLRLNVSITYLELARWVQLFQQLLTNGNQPLWSLQLSWEHTYLSSLGEAEGKDIIAHALTCYLSRSELSKFELLPGYSLCLPGGWPKPLKLRDYVWYSKETSVKQNCMYLGFLGAQSASYKCRSAWDCSPVEQALSATGFKGPYVMDMKMLHVMMFPNFLHEVMVYYGRQMEMDVVIAQKKLLFAANWTIEQATENDLELYLLWFSWFGSQLHPLCNFFSSFLNTLKKELKHPIWNCILHCRHELLSYSKVELDSWPIPMLSMELIDLVASNGLPKLPCNLLQKAIHCVGLLRASFQQWQTESECHYSDKNKCFLPVLRSLRRVEEKVLDVLVESSEFDVLFQLYKDLLEDHISFWNSIRTSQFEFSVISWRSLMKNAEKLQKFFPKELEELQMEGNNLHEVSSWRFHSQKSLLWVHGGHPSLPSSADLYEKQHQLLKLCELLWPRDSKTLAKANDYLIEASVSLNPEFRSLAMQGVCMSWYILGGIHDNELQVVQQLEEMHQMLLRRFEHEKEKMQTVMGATASAFPLENLASCCVFSPSILCGRTGFDSWQDTLPIVDNTSIFFDMELLQELSQIVLVDSEGLQFALSGLSDILESTLNFSLNLSSRPPTDFLAHQKMLWTLDAWRSANAGNAKIASFVLEMWFSWHSSLWTIQPVLVKNVKRMDDYKFPHHDNLFQPVRMATVDQILKSTFSIKDYHLHCLKFRVASRNIWQSCSSVTNVESFLISTARHLFQQIIFAHQKSFEADKFNAIKSTFHSFQKKVVMQNDIKVLLALLLSSSHHGFASLVDSFIRPVLEELYLPYPSSDLLYNIGCAWLRVGGLRYHLLITCDELDPTLKYSCKYLKLVENIASLELENEVRKDCVYLAGQFLFGEADVERAKSLENLKAQCKKLKQKVVFRPDPGKFVKLKNECDEFLKLVATAVALTKDVSSMDVQQASDRVCNWQETATRFIEWLSSGYSSYVDIIQPVQVAIYEMKLGLSLVLSSLLQKKFLDRIGQDNMEKVQDTVFAFMRFPRGFAFEAGPVKFNCGRVKFPSSDVEFPTDVKAMDMSLLETLITSTRDLNSDKMVSVLQLKVALRHNILRRVTDSIAVTQLMDNASFMLLDKIFDEFASLWLDMKVKLRAKEEDEAQHYKFKPRAFKIENIIETDISSMGDLLTNETLSEWQELLSEEDVTEKKGEKDDDALEEEWNSMQDALNSTVDIHNQLFGSMDLVQAPGLLETSTAECLSSFLESYMLGGRMISGFKGLQSSSLDSKLAPEHLFRLCLEYDQKFCSARKPSYSYNFYKDSNAPVMAEMVDKVTALQLRILSLSTEWNNHPALQKILDVIDMILAIPVSTPLAKALSGLQFLVNRVRVLQETVSKFPLSGELEPIFHLVSSWQKLEFESWPACLDEIQVQFEINAGKLWFPLYSVLRHRHSAEVAEYDRSTILSLEEFIQTSSVGEFKRRLQLLFAFHGHFSTGICQDSYVSPCHLENVKILYNIFGFYVQYLPRILEHVECARKKVELELKDLLKLCQWEHPESHVSIENSKRTRQKLRKLIQKYTDVLQQPVMLIINQEAEQRGITMPSVTQVQKSSTCSFEKNKQMLKVVYDQAVFTDKDRSEWFIEWQKKVDHLHNMDFGRTADFEFPIFTFNNVEGIKYWEESKHMWFTVENICRTVIDYTDLWKDESKSLGKRRALSDLLKLLEGCGLSKHRAVLLEDPFRSDQVNSWILQPSYQMKHLLLPQGGLSSREIVPPTCQFASSPIVDPGWETANQYYFKSMASTNLLQHICLNFHKDFTLEQVNRTVSFLDHLLAIQQEQRAAAYSFAQHMSCLRTRLSDFRKLFCDSLAFDSETSRECCFAQNQNATLNCMWQQKQLFDSLSSMLHEECLMLKTVEGNHLNTCQRVQAAANRVHISIEKFIPDIKKSKDLLDSYLVGCGGVVTSSISTLHPCFVSKQMELLVFQNFQMIKELEDHLYAFRRQDEDRRCVKEILLSHLGDIFKKVNIVAEHYKYSVQTSSIPGIDHEVGNYHGEGINEMQAWFDDTLKETYKHIADAFHGLECWSSDHDLSAESLGNITMWKTIFESHVSNLRLEDICGTVVKVINSAAKLVNHHINGKHHFCLWVGMHLKNLYSLLDLILTFSDCLLHDFLAVHRMVSIITYVLANSFASLYSRGFGIPNEDQSEESSIDKTQDAKGTGMGEGVGMNDVSDQINDEDQLLGTEKLTEEQDDLNEVPDKNEKGIEMEQDFVADTYSVSEESEGDDDNGNEDDEDEQQLESAMGDAGTNSEIVDERLGDKNDEDSNNAKEKYESGPSVNDADSSGRELRAKDDPDPASPNDEDGELNPHELGKQDENENQDGADTEENVEDMKLDKAEAFTDPTELNIDEPKWGSDEDINMDEQESAETMEDGSAEDPDEPDNIGKDEEDTKNSLDKSVEEAEAEQVDGNADRDDSGNAEERNTEMNLHVEVPKKETLEPSTSDLTVENASIAESTTQPKGDSKVPDLRDVAPQAPEAKWSNSTDIQNELSPMSDLPNATEVEVRVPDTSTTGRISKDQPQSQFSQNELSSQKAQPNPCRSIGDALEKWKERVQVSVDIEHNNVEDPDSMQDEDAEEYGYTSEFDKGTAQALGPATDEQMDKNTNADQPDGDSKTIDREGISEMEVEKQDSETHPIRASASNTRKGLRNIWISRI